MERVKSWAGVSRVADGADLDALRERLEGVVERMEDLCTIADKINGLVDTQEIRRQLVAALEVPDGE